MISISINTVVCERSDAFRELRLVFATGYCYW